MYPNAGITPHVHTADCWRENLDCAIAKVEELSMEVGTLRTLLAKAQLDIRQIGGVLDRIEGAFDRVLNPPPKRW